MESYDIVYNGITGSEKGIILYDYASYSGAEKEYDQYTIPGMTGQLVGETSGKSNLVITCTMSLKNDAFSRTVSDVKRWLRGTGELSFTDDATVYYKVWKVNYGDINRELRNFGTFTVDFVCTPYQFLTSGKTPVNDIANNPYDLCRPIYTIAGTGSFTLSLNGKQMSGTSNGSIIIDTERMIAYNSQGVNQNSLISGDYEDLHIPEGNVNLSISEGFTVSVIPQWGYDV